MKWFIRLFVNIALAWLTIYFVQWLVDDDFQRFVTIMLAVFLVEMSSLRDMIGDKN